jgi:hypothetical protein
MTPLAQAIVAQIRAQAQQFSDVVDSHRAVPWPDFLRAW